MVSPACPRRCALALLVGLAASLLLARTAAAKEPEHLEWHKILISGQPAGHARLLRRPREGGGHVVTMTQKLALRRGTVVVEIQSTATTEEDGAGKLTGFHFIQRLSKEAIEAHGKADGAVLKVSETAGGGPARAYEIPLDPRAVGLRRAEELMQERLRRPGDTLEVVIFFPEVRKCGTQKVVLEAEEPDASAPGTDRKLRRLKSTMDVLPGTTMTQWVDSDFEQRRAAFSVMGLAMEMLRSTPEEILKADLGSPPEIFFATAIPVARKVPEGAREARYRLEATGDDELPTADSAKAFPGVGHKVEAIEGKKALVLRIRRPDEPPPARRGDATGPGYAELLAPNTYVSSDDPQIAAIAEREVGAERDAVRAARALERWVHDNVRTKNLSTAFAGASEVLKTREGDCTEHAVLLAALLRAARIPARVVAGLVYYDGAFVGHMWTEAYVGEWIALDATRAGRPVGPDHIALSTSSLSSGSVMDFFLHILPILGKVKIEVLEVKE